MEPLLGEIKLFAGNFAPNGWFTCEGQTLPINQYTALFSILGTYYGGDGMTTFQLPDLRSSFPTQVSNIGGSRRTPYTLGQIGGNQNVTLTAQQMPAHNHPLMGTGAASNQPIPGGNALSTHIDPSKQLPDGLYNDLSDTSVELAALHVKSVGVAGGSQAVDITPPFLAMQYIIAWQGVYPSRP